MLSRAKKITIQTNVVTCIKNTHLLLSCSNKGCNNYMLRCLRWTERYRPSNIHLYTLRSGSSARQCITIHSYTHPAWVNQRPINSNVEYWQFFSVVNSLVTTHKFPTLYRRQLVWLIVRSRPYHYAAEPLYLRHRNLPVTGCYSVIVTCMMHGVG